MFDAWTTLGSIALVTSLNSRTCSPAKAAVEAAIKLAAPIRILEKQIRLLRMMSSLDCASGRGRRDRRL
jgi:hypothetical protein